LQTGQIIWILTVAFFALSVIIPTASPKHGGLYLLVLLALIAVMFLLGKGGSFSLKLTVFHWNLLGFTLFCFCSALWAVRPELSINRGLDRLEMFFALSLLYLCFQNAESVRPLLKVIMWSGFFVVFYSFYSLGWSQVVDLITTKSRVSNALINSNMLGMTAAYSVVICIYFALFDKARLDIVFTIPSVLIIAATGSRKAFVILVFGFVCLLAIKALSNRSILKNIALLLAMIAVIVILYNLLSRFSLFAGTLERIQMAVNGFLGEGEYDGSTQERMHLIEIGRRLFKEHPLLGVGIENPSVFTEMEIGKKNFYLHNNYWELLAGGGVIGLALYYWIYVYLMVCFWKYRDFKDDDFIICSLLFFLRLVMDYGAVEYETKSTYLFLLIFVFQAEKMRKRNNVDYQIEKEISNALGETVSS